MIINLINKDNKKIAELESTFPNVLKVGSIKNDFKNNPYTKYLIYIDNNKILGFLNYNLIYDRIEIVNFNVLNNVQNKGIGSKLMEELIKEARLKKCQNITLEVRKDNQKAIHIYKKYGFKEVAIREKYYQNMDGILMEKELM